MLVVLDNAANALQVRPLLPGSSGCLVLITSRSQLGGLVIHDGANRMTVDMFPPREAISLLGAILGHDRIGAEPTAAADLADTRSHATLAELTAELSGANGRLDALATADGDESTTMRAVLSWSYTSLPLPVARAFRLLGLHPGPDFSDTAAAALLRSSLTAVRRHLDALTGAHLLTRDAERYRFHDLLREYAAELARAEEQAESEDAVHSMLTWYLTTTQAADRLLYQEYDDQAAPRVVGGLDAPLFASRDQALAWCRKEHANLVAATRFADSIGDDITSWRLPAAMREYFQLRLPFADWLAVAEIGLAAALRLDDRPAQAAMHSSLGGAYNYQGRPQQCLDHQLQALAICRGLGSEATRHESGITIGMTLVNTGGAYLTLGRHEEAIALLEEARDIAKLASQHDVMGHALESLGCHYRLINRFDDALICLQEALAAFNKINRPYGQLITIIGLAETYVALEQHEHAVEQAKYSEEISNRIGSRREEETSLGILAYAFRKLSQHSAATERWQRAMAIVEELGNNVDPDCLEYLRKASPDPPPSSS